MFWNKYPYTDMHELNLDWILAEIMKLHHDYDEFKAVNEITNAGAWDITKQYQAWTIVSDNNVGYISLKPVPAGVAISNTEYWGLIADYDVVVSDLANRVATLEGQMTTLTGTTIPAIQAGLTGLNYGYGLLANRRVVMIGDSYADHTPETWQTTLKTALDLDNDDCFAYAEPGGGFTKAGNNGYKFLGLLQAHNLDITDHDTITDIVVCAGANDYYYYIDQNTLANAIADFFTYVNTIYTHAKVWISMVGNSKYKDSTKMFNLQKTVQIFEQITTAKGGCYMAGLHNIMHDAHNFDDFVHPTQQANALIGYGAASYMKGGDFTYVSPRYNTTITPSSNVSSMSTPTQGGLNYVTWQIVGDVTNFTMPRIDVLFSSSQDVGANDPPSIPICEFDDTEMLWPNKEFLDAMHYAFNRYSGTVTQGSFRVLPTYTDTVNLTPAQPNGQLLIGGGTNFASPYKSDLISISAFSVTVPTISL